MSRYNEIQEFLQEAHNVTGELNAIKEKLIKDNSVTSLAKPRVSAVLNHLRTCLDYVAADIVQTLLIPSNTLSPKELKQVNNNFHFPYGADKNIFDSRIGLRLPKLTVINFSLYQLIENIQPHISGDFAISDLCHNNNKIKHETSEQIRENRNVVGIGRLSPSEPAISIVDSEDFSFNGSINGRRVNVHIKNTNKPETITGDIDQVFYDIIDLKFYFPNSNTDILTIINNALLTVKEFVENAYLILQK